MAEVWIPVAFSEEEALHLLGAARAVFGARTAMGGDTKEAAPLAQAMVRLAEATDVARTKARFESVALSPQSRTGGDG